MGLTPELANRAMWKHFLMWDGLSRFSRAFHELAESEGDSFWEWFVIMGWPAPLGAIR
jgi:hypothetical protein